jgi:hypothetical protein
LAEGTLNLSEKEKQYSAKIEALKRDFGDLYRAH